MKKLMLILMIMCFGFLAKAQLFDGKFISPANDSILLIIEAEQTVVLDTFIGVERNHYGNSPYVGIMKLTVPMNGLFQFGSGQYYTLYNNSDGELKTRWLGWLTSHKYMGSSVMTDSRRTQFWIIQYDEKGLPYRHHLPELIFSNYR